MKQLSCRTYFSLAASMCRASHWRPFGQTWMGNGNQLWMRTLINPTSSSIQ